MKKEIAGRIQELTRSVKASQKPLLQLIPQLFEFDHQLGTSSPQERNSANFIKLKKFW